MTTMLFAQARQIQDNRNQVIVEKRVEQAIRPIDDRIETKDLLYSDDYLRRFRTYITREVRLSTREANNFFALYEELQAKKHKLNHEIMLAQYKLANDRIITEREALKIIDRLTDIDLEIAKLEKNYLNKYKRFLSATKILMIKVAEEDFQNQYLEEAQRRRFQQLSTPVYSTMPVAPRTEPTQTPPRTTNTRPGNDRRSR